MASVSTPTATSSPSKPALATSATPAADRVELSTPALTPAAADLPLTTEERMVQALDADGNGLVSQDEFLKTSIQELRRARNHGKHTDDSSHVKERVPAWAGKLRSMFKAADLDHNGSVDSQEMRAGLKDPSLMEGSPYRVRNMTVSAVAFRKSLANLP